jgi:hypothetical protein
MPRNRFTRVMKHYSPTGRRNYGRLWRAFWIRETGTGQQMAQIHDRYMMMMMMRYIGSQKTYPLFLSDFNSTCIFSTDFRKIRQFSWKSVQWEPSCSMRTDGQTWRRLCSFFRNFPNAPKNVA